MAVFDEVRYSLSPALPPTRRNELAAVLDLNGAAPHPPYTHLIALPASHAHSHDANNPAVKLVTDRWVDRSIIMGKRQPEQFYSPDPAMIFSGVVACATDLSAPDLEVLSAGITALGGQWRIGLTRDVTHLFALHMGSDKYNTALHFAPQTHMCIVTPHWFDDAVRLGRRVPETPYMWPDPPVLQPGLTLVKGSDGKQKQKHTEDAEREATDAPHQGEQVQVWQGRRILLAPSLELGVGSRRAIEARIRRAGGVVVPIADDADEDVEGKAVDGCDVLISRWRSGKSYFKAARASILIGTLSWLFSVESSGTLHSPLDSLLWYPTPRGGILGLADCEISITNYTGAARDYLKHLITLVGAKFTPSMSQSNKVLLAGFQPSPKTTRALSWSIPVVNHTWLEDCIIEWRTLTVGLERYIVYPPGIDFGQLLMTRHDGFPASPSSPAPRLSGGVVPGGRGIGPLDVNFEETRDAEYRLRTAGGHALSVHEAFTHDTTADEISMVVEGDRSVRHTSKRGSVGTARTTTGATGAFVDRVIELGSDDGERGDGMRRGWTNGKPTSAEGSWNGAAPASRAEEGAETGKSPGGGNNKGKGKRTGNTAQDGDADQPRADDEGKRTPVRAQRPILGSDGELSRDNEGSVPPRRPTSGSKTPVKSGMKPRPRSMSHSRPRSIHGEDSAEEGRMQTLAGKPRKDDVEPGRRMKPTEGPSGKQKGATRRHSLSRSPSPAFDAIRSTSRTPRRRMSVLVPSVPKGYFSSQSMRDDEDAHGVKEAGAVPESRRKLLEPAASVGAVAAETSVSTGKRGRPRKSGPVNVPGESTKTKGSKTRVEDAEDANQEDDEDVSMVVDEPLTLTSHRGHKRGAASKATARLREVVMPDVVNFEKERKQAKRRWSEGGESAVSAMRREADKARARKRRKATPEEEEEEEEEVEVLDVVLVASAKAKSTGGKRRSKATAAVYEDEDVDMEAPSAKGKKGERGRGKTVGSDGDVDSEGPRAKGKGGGRVKGRPKTFITVSSDEDIDSEGPSMKGKGARGRGKEGSDVRLMTTAVSLSDDVIKRLTKLGVQMTTKPTDCTHLIAKGIVRTEKFLCAMSVSPYVLTEGWANASAKAGKLLDEHDYLLSDAAAEKKWGFKWADAMTRAKGPEGGPSLFKQMTFYVTPKVSMDVKLLRAIVSAGGGQVQTNTMPTVRILKGKAHRYVVTCPEDKVIWRPLVEGGFKVYSAELVLRAALRQEIEWEREECLVAG